MAEKLQKEGKEATEKSFNQLENRKQDVQNEIDHLLTEKQKLDARIKELSDSKTMKTAEISSLDASIQEDYDQRLADNPKDLQDQDEMSREEIISIYEKKIENMNKHIKNLESLCKQERQAKDHALEILREESKKLLSKHQDLLGEKVALDLEIAAHRKQLEGDKARGGKKKPEESVTGKQPLRSSSKRKRSCSSTVTAQRKATNCAADNCVQPTTVQRSISFYIYGTMEDSTLLDIGIDEHSLDAALMAPIYDEIVAPIIAELTNAHIQREIILNDFITEMNWVRRQMAAEGFHFPNARPLHCETGSSVGEINRIPETAPLPPNLGPPPHPNEIKLTEDFAKEFDLLKYGPDFYKCNRKISHECQIRMRKCDIAMHFYKVHKVRKTTFNVLSSDPIDSADEFHFPDASPLHCEAGSSVGEINRIPETAPLPPNLGPPPFPNEIKFIEDFAEEFDLIKYRPDFYTCNRNKCQIRMRKCDIAMHFFRVHKERKTTFNMLSIDPSDYDD